jgi:lysophospholipase L1-like esterase
MSARGRLMSRLVTMVIALAGFVAAGALPAGATPSTIDYVALGDSYAAGTASQLGDCPHGPDAYPVLLAGSDDSRIDLKAFDACSGWTTSDVVKVVDSSQSPLDRNTRLVTLTIGAGNLGLSRVLAACTANPPTPNACQAQIGRALGDLGDCPGSERPSSLDSPLTKLYTDVAGQARGARIVVTGYPLLFETPDPTAPNAGIINGINEATTRLNCVIERAVAATQATYANITYVDVTKEFAGGGIVIPAPPDLPCTDPSAFIHSLLDCNTAPPRDDPEAFHPMPAGYKAYADAIKAKLPSGWLIESST